jgi:hypothetical protein
MTTSFLPSTYTSTFYPTGRLPTSCRVFGRCRAFDRFASVDAHLCIPDNSNGCEERHPVQTLLSPSLKGCTLCFMLAGTLPDQVYYQAWKNTALFLRTLNSKEGLSVSFCFKFSNAVWSCLVRVLQWGRLQPEQETQSAIVAALLKLFCSSILSEVMNI